MSLVEPVAEWPKQWLQEGREKGIAEGRAQGVAEGRDQGVAEGAKARPVDTDHSGNLLNSAQSPRRNVVIRAGKR